LDKIKAGFASPVGDFVEKYLDLNELMVKHPIATFFVRVSGDSMKDAGISDGDILVVDRSLNAENNQIIVAVVNGEFTVKRLKKNGIQIYLYPENSKYKPVLITKNMDFLVWGVVTYVVKDVG